MRKIIIPIANGDLIIKTDEVSHFSAEGERYSWLIMITGKRKLIQVSLEEVLNTLPIPPFYRVHNEHIVHIDQMKKIVPGDSMQLELFSGLILPVSKNSIEGLIN